MTTPLGPVVPVLARRGAYIPQVGKRVNILLPGELVTAVVDEIVSNDVIVATIDSVVLNKSGHNIKRGDPIAVQRKLDELGIEQWMPVDDRQVRMREIAHRMAEEEAAKALPPPPPPEEEEPPPEPEPEILPAMPEFGLPVVEVTPSEPPAAARRRRRR